MQHSIEQWIDRINSMKDLCIHAHRLRNEFSELSGKQYDAEACKHTLQQVQELARGIANEEITEIKTEMDEWKK